MGILENANAIPTAAAAADFYDYQIAGKQYLYTLILKLMRI